MSVLVKNGTLLDGKFDVLIEDGKIKRIEIHGKIDESEVQTVIDATGKYVLPGLVDAHCHLRDPGFEYKEDIASGTLSAARGGFTSIACMPNTNPVIDNASVVWYIKERAQKEGLVNVYPIGAVSTGQNGEALSEMGDMKKAGIVAVSDDGRPVKSSGLMKKAMQYADMLDLRIISHCEDLALVSDGVMNEGFNSTVMGLKGIPSVSEDIMVARDVSLAEYLGVFVHIAHVSTKGAVEIIRQAKKRGVKVTCETCPHYFTLTDDACQGFNTLAKVNPPLRSKTDKEAIIEGLVDGTIDIIATDHAPHHVDEKNVEFDKALNGMVGFETALLLGLTYLVEKGFLSIGQLIEKLSLNPSRMLGIDKGYIKEGKDADLIVVDLKERFEVNVDSFSSKAKNSPFGGMMLSGKVCNTIVGGKLCL